MLEVTRASGLADLADAAGLLGCGRRNLANDVADAFYRADDFVHRDAMLRTGRQPSPAEVPDAGRYSQPTQPL